MDALNPVYKAAKTIGDFFSVLNWKYCFIGGIAIQRWGEPRFTIDVDVTLLTGFGSEEKFANELLSHFAPRRPDALDFALQTRVLLVEDENKVPMDIAFGAMPFEERTISRASPFLFSQGVTLITCSVEDLIVHKAFANREIDWADIEGVLYRQGKKLNINLILKELKPLVELKEEPEILEKLKQKIAQGKKYLS